MFLLKIAPTLVLLYGLSLVIRTWPDHTNQVESAIGAVLALALVSAIALLWLAP
jgi:uncharacterized membrane protein